MPWPKRFRCGIKVNVFCYFQPASDVFIVFIYNMQMRKIENEFVAKW